MKQKVMLLVALALCAMPGCGSDSKVSTVETDKSVVFYASVDNGGFAKNRQATAVHAANEEFAKWKLQHPEFSYKEMKTSTEGDVYTLRVQLEKSDVAALPK